MTAENFDVALTAMKRRIPFQPFAVALINGDRLEVDHPEAVIFRDGVAVFYGPGGILQIFDREGVAQFVGDLMNSPETAA